MNTDSQEEEQIFSQSESSKLLTSVTQEEIDETEQYEKIINAIGHGRFQIILLLICGWALASDSTEVQVCFMISTWKLCITVQKKTDDYNISLIWVWVGGVIANDVGCEYLLTLTLGKSSQVNKYHTLFVRVGLPKTPKSLQINHKKK